MQEWTAQLPEYWHGMLEKLRSHGVDVTRQEQKSMSRRWMDFHAGRSGVNIYLGCKANMLQVGLNLQTQASHDAMQSFRILDDQKERIEFEFGADIYPRIWGCKTAKRCSVRCEKMVDFKGAHRNEWPAFQEWMTCHLIEFQRVFLPRVGGL